MNSLSRLLLPALVAIGISLTCAVVAAGTHGMTFPSAKEGFDRIVAAARAGDEATLDKILGPDGKDILHSGDSQADQAALQRFIAAYDAKQTLVQDGPTKATLTVGTDDWPMPIPIVKGADGWYFDTAAGRMELLMRRIGRNELSTIEACKAFVDAQLEYASTDRGDGLIDYAQRFISTPGKTDGLYWPAKAGEPQSPLGPLFAKAQLSGLSRDKSGAPQPYNGYYFRILTEQGPNAKGGAYSYLAHGKLMGGFGLVAYPATYGVSGVMTFIVNQDGVVYQRDLGPNTGAAAAQIKAFDPGPGWKKA